MHLAERRRDIGKPMALADRGRERLGDLANEAGAARAALDRGVQPAAHLTRLDPFGQRVDRDEPSGMDGLGVGALERRLAELKRAPEESDLSRDPHPLALAVRLLHERASEPGRAHVGGRAVLLGELGLGHELAGRGPSLRDTSERRDGGLARVRHEAAERDELGEVVEARWQMP